MALVSVVSFAIRDYVGGKKAVPFYVPASMSLTDVQSGVTTMAAALDAAIDGSIDSVRVSIGLTLPGGIKGSPVNGHTVREGGLLGFDAQNTDYKYSEFIPTWEEAGFAGNVVLTSGVYGTFQDDVVSLFTDDQANSILSFVAGKRAYRK